MSILIILGKILIFAPPLLAAIIPHEVAHGLAAERLGDPTARRLGRITLNPLKHIDRFMTIILPGMLILLNSPVIFGGAKPVPVDPRHFKNPRRGMAYVAIAGPLVNFFLAGILYVISPFVTVLFRELSLPESVEILILIWIGYGMLINLTLGLFNLIPVPPLDGGRIAVGFLPIPLARLLARLEPYGLLIVFLFLYWGIPQIILDPAISLVEGHLGRLENLYFPPVETP